MAYETSGGVGFGAGMSAGLIAPAPPTLNLSRSAPMQAPAPVTGGLLQKIGGDFAAAAPFMPVIGTVGSLLLNGIGMWMQNKYQKEQQEKVDKWQAMQNAIAVRENSKQWAWMEDDRDYGRSLDFMKNLLGMMNENKQLENNLLTMWRTAA